MSVRRFRGTPGGVCWLGQQVVWCPMYRRRVVGGRVAAGCGELLERIADERRWEMVAQEVMGDHVQLLVRVGPPEAAAQVARAFTGRTARVLGPEFCYLRWFVRELWSPSYFAALVGHVSGSAVCRDIGHRWDAVAL